MTKRGQIWKCEICGNIIEILHLGSDSLVCCGKSMILQKENTSDASKEKHIPIINGNYVMIGSIPHPMEDKHFIEWIEATGENNEIAKIFLKPGNKPEAKFSFKVKFAREYCNIHRLWKS